MLNEPVELLSVRRRSGDRAHTLHSEESLLVLPEIGVSLHVRLVLLQPHLVQGRLSLSLSLIFAVSLTNFEWSLSCLRLGGLIEFSSIVLEDGSLVRLVVRRSIALSPELCVVLLEVLALLVDLSSLFLLGSAIESLCVLLENRSLFGLIILDRSGMEVRGVFLEMGRSLVHWVW